MNLASNRRRLALATLLAAGLPAVRPMPAVAEDAVVCVLEEHHYEVRDNGEEAKERVREQYAINRLGRGSDGLRHVAVPNSFPYEAHQTRIRVWNGDGLRFRYDQNFFKDVAVGGDEFVTDSRMLYLQIDPLQAGDTLEVSYELRIHPFLGLPVYTFSAGGLRTSTSTYEVDLPLSLGPRHREWNGLGEPEVERHGDRLRWTWTVNDLEPYEQEMLGPPSADVFPTVSIGVDRIAWGPADTWEHLGQTYWEKAREQVEAVPSGDLPSRRNSGIAPLELALSRVQNNVRYVAIKLQEGKWIPHRSRETLRRKYGDCTDMAALLLAVLDGEDRDASLAAVATRGSCGLKVDPLPTLLFFNHMVVCAGTDPDHPVWLDATDPHGTDRNPRWDIQGAQALVVSGPCAGFRRIAVNDPAGNRTMRSLRLREEPGGHWTALFRAQWTGSPAQRMQLVLEQDLEPVELARRLVEKLRCKPAAELSADGIRLVKTASDTLGLEMSFPAESPFDPAGRVLSPGWERDPFPLDVFADAGRKTDVYWSMVGTRTDSLIVESDTAPPALLPDSTWTVEARDLVCTLSQRSTPRSVCLVRTFTTGSLVYPVADWEAGREARRRILRWSTRNLAGKS